MISSIFAMPVCTVMSMMPMMSLMSLTVVHVIFILSFVTVIWARFVLSGTIVVLEDCDVLNVLFLFGISADSHRLSFSVQFLRIQNYSIPD